MQISYYSVVFPQSAHVALGGAAAGALHGSDGRTNVGAAVGALGDAAVSVDTAHSGGALGDAAVNIAAAPFGGARGLVVGAAVGALFCLFCI